MNVFDFDGTIYNGDSSVDFWLFCLKKNPFLIRFFPKQISGIILYKLGKISKEEFKSRFFSFFAGIADINRYVCDFWDKNERKIKEWYKTIRKEDDCVISASPRFLLEEICSRIEIKNLIATEVDKLSGKIIGENCHDKNKPVFYEKDFGDITIDNFYSDSKSDLPMAELAKNAYSVKGNKFVNWRISKNYDFF